ncbi:MAG TPA: NAD(P)-dependent oxidoreductase, partial [Polyangium sp.]|nr:NAD(P)-dependent oxidoreductase [Polyangium sp.]
LTHYVPFTATVLARLPRCKAISIASVGWDCIDVPAAMAAGIHVAAVGEYCTEEAADHTLALLLALGRRLLDYHRQVQAEHDWRWNAITGIERLSGRTLGIVGFGRIGRAVCRRALGFGLRVIASDPGIDAATAAAHGATLVDFETLLAKADIVSLHCNLNNNNHGLFDRTAFARLRRRPLLINVARGALIDESALVEALNSGHIAAAALDVLAEDSPDLTCHPLAGRPDVVLTPHVAFYSETALVEVRRISTRNLRAAVEGRLVDVFRLVTPTHFTS